MSAKQVFPEQFDETTLHLIVKIEPSNQILCRRDIQWRDAKYVNIGPR
jgi:hypothetical protein